MNDQRDTSGAVDLRGMARRSDALSGAGGSSGGGTSAGAGQPDGGTLDELEAGLPSMTGGVSAEAATLGPADGALADAAGAMSGAALTGGIGEAIGAGAGGDVGSGTDADRGDLGGGGTGPEGTAKPGGA